MSVADQLETAGTEVAPYLDIIRAYDKAAAKWHRQGRKIVKRYLDERGDQQANRLRYNILWANVETLKPAIYAKTPKPEVERRFLDKDPVGRQASEVLERCLEYYLGITPFGSTMRQIRNDYLLVGRGVSWVRYEPSITAGMLTDDAQIGDHANDAAPAEEITWETVMSDYVHWQDFGHSIARTWEEVEVVWRKVYMSRDQLKKRAEKGGFEDWNSIPLDHVAPELKDSEGDNGKKAAIYEIWDKSKRCVYWLSKSWPKFLDQRDDPLGLDRFFPCSEPVYATLANETLIPVPDYVEYQDQATELDELTARISALQKAIKAAGVYDASQQAVGRLLSEGVVNTLIPVDAWAALAEKGGLKGTMELLPMEEIAKTLLMLYEARERVKQDLYEITGMSDIIRGATKASETATAQNIKNNYITLRLSEKQREMQRFARNTLEIMGNIICRHFQDNTIRMVSGVKLLTQAEKAQVQMQQQYSGQPNPTTGQPIPAPDDDILELLEEPSWDEVLSLLRDNPERSFRIDIETDSTIEMDAQQDRDEAMQFLQSVAQFIEQTQNLPLSLAPLAGQMLEYGVRKWRVGRQLEGAINATVKKLEKDAENPQQKPDPAMAKVQQDGQIAQAKLQSDQQTAQARIQADVQIEQMRLSAQQHVEQMKAQIDQQAQQAKADRDAQFQAVQMHMEHQRQAQADMMQGHAQAVQSSIDEAFERWKAMLDAQTKIEVAEIAAGATLDAAQITAAKQGASD